MKTVELLGLNVQSGGFDHYRPIDENSNPPEREDALDDFLNAQQQDGVTAAALTDTYGWREYYGSDIQIAEHTGFRWAHHQPLNDDRLTQLYGETQVGVTFATDHAVDERESVPVRLENRDALKTVLKLGNRTLHVFTLYLDDVSDETRERQVRALFSQGVLDLGEPTVLIGDKNSPSPDLKGAPLKHRIDDLGFRAISFAFGLVPDRHSLEQILGLINRADKAPTINYYKQALRGMNRRTAIRMIEEHGFTDADQTHQPTFRRGFGRKLQLDHIMHRSPTDKPLAVSNFKVIAAPSDHDATRATIDL